VRTTATEINNTLYQRLLSFRLKFAIDTQNRSAMLEILSEVIRTPTGTENDMSTNSNAEGCVRKTKHINNSPFQRSLGSRPGLAGDARTWRRIY
jgi:hypothetical protein